MISSNFSDGPSQGCRCPGSFEVCATELRFRSIHDLHDELLAQMYPALGYCRTGALPVGWELGLLREGLKWLD